MHGQPDTGRLNFRQLIRVCLVVSLSVAASSTTSTVHAQGQPAPVTMGSLVMMRAQGDPAATAAIGAALSHPEPGMRAVAARLVAVGGLSALAPDLIVALGAEKVDAVAAEQVAALVMLGIPDAVEGAASHLAVAGPRARDAFALEAARFAPERLQAELPFLLGHSQSTPASALTAAVALSARLHPATRGALLAAWLDHAPPSTWSDIARHLTSASAADASELPVLVATLSSPRIEHREPTVWLLLKWISEGQSVPATLLEAGLPRPGGGELTWERFGRELLARHVTSVTTDDRSTFLAGEAQAHQIDARSARGLVVLTRQEQAALDKVLGPQPARQSAASAAVSHPRVRVFENIWGGFLSSLLEATGCRPTEDWRFGGARLTYSSLGRPTRLAIDPSRVSAECARATTALAQVSLSRRSDPVSEGDLEWVLFPTARTFLACADGLDRGTPAPDPAGLRIAAAPGDI